MIMFVVVITDIAFGEGQRVVTCVGLCGGCGGVGELIVNAQSTTFSPANCHS